MDTSQLTFTFVDDSSLRTVLEEYHHQTLAALSSGCHLGAIAGCASLVEGLLTWALVRLAHEDESGILRSDVKRHGLEDCYEPMGDWTAPSQKQIGRVLGFVARALADGKAVAVSCGAGYGRTGTVLACYLVSKGIP